MVLPQQRRGLRGGQIKKSSGSMPSLYYSQHGAAVTSSWLTPPQGHDNKGQRAASRILSFRGTFENANIFPTRLLQPTLQGEDVYSHLQYVTKVCVHGCVSVCVGHKKRKTRRARLIQRKRFNVVCHRHLPPLMKSLHVPPTETPILHFCP